MEDSKKKPIMIGIAVVCLVLAIGITYMRSSSSTSGADSLKGGEMMWVKCGNPNCGAEYEVDKKAYYKDLESNPLSLPTCQKCSEQSIYEAVKCEKCGIVFFKGAVPNDIKDRCPECGYSKIDGTVKPPTPAATPAPAPAPAEGK